VDSPFFLLDEPNIKSTTVLIYLNEDFEEGYLNFLDRDLTIKPKKLSLILFDSTELHTITKVLSGVRIAMPIWATNIKEKEVSYEL
jgi:predicted 2-oxoglutarate/Fe(II)-dependent dioxygenase YbiX